MVTNVSISEWGDVYTKEAKRGLEFYAFNRERGRSLHIGTLKGTTYEKGRVSILLKPERSIALKPEEYQAATEAGGVVFRVQTTDGETYVIMFDDFNRLKDEYYNPTYGKQWRVALHYFQRSATTAKRNPILDTPRRGDGKGKKEYVRPQPQQLPMFRPMFDDLGNCRGGKV